MSGSNRGLYIVATIGAFAFFGLGVAGESRCQREYYSGNSHNKADDSYDSKSLRFDRGWIPCLVERETANPKVGEANEKEQRDLIAQEAMALWAFWVAVFAGITALITSAGTILIWRQVSLTRAAVEDTGKATKAMRKANKIARKQFRLQTKPILTASISGPYATSRHETRMIEPGEKQRWVTFSPTVELKNWSDMPCFIERFNIDMLDEGNCPIGRWEDKGIVLSANGVPSFKHQLNTGLMMTAELREKWKHWPQPIIGIVDFTDHIGTKYRQMFAFAPRTIHDAYFKRWGGSEYNNEQLIK